MSLLTQLRSGILPLRIETGRFHSIKDNVTGQTRKLKVEERYVYFALCKRLRMRYILSVNVLSIM